MDAIQHGAQFEEKIYQEYSRDGAGETLMGVALCLGGLGMASHTSGVTAFLPLLLILIGRAWKKRITYPRLGYAAIVGKKRTTRKRGFLLVVLTLLLVGTLLYLALSPATPGAPLPHEKLVLGAFVAAIIAGAGIALRLRAVWGVAIVLLGLFAVADYGEFSAGWPMFATGLILLPLGLLRLRRFLRDYPVLESSDGAV